MHKAWGTSEGGEKEKDYLLILRQDWTVEWFHVQRLPVILTSFLLTAYHWLFISCRLQCKSQAGHIISSNLQPSRLLLYFSSLYFFCTPTFSAGNFCFWDFFFTCCSLCWQCWSLYPHYWISSLAKHQLSSPHSSSPHCIF